MGWISTKKHGTANAVHNIAVGDENKTEKEEETQHLEHAVDGTYPILSSRLADKDLPIIPADVVMRCDGKDGRRLWLVVNDVVLDCTSYVRSHPGGQQIIVGFGGQDCSWQWFTFHSREIWTNVAMKLRVGMAKGIENRHIKPKQFIGLRGFGYQED